MPSATARAALPIRPYPRRAPVEIPPAHQPQTNRRLKHRPCTSYPENEDSYLQDLSFHPVQQHVPSSYEARPAKRPMPSPSQTIVVINSSGRQAASFIRVASAVGYHVRAQLRNLDGLVANEISSLPNVKVVEGDLYSRRASSAPPPLGGGHGNTGVNHALISDLFHGAQLAFINTTFWGDETAIGKALADAAAKAKIQHYIFSSMPDHSLHSPRNSREPWPSLPLWSSKAAISSHIESIPSLASKTTHLLTGIYNNNFTSLPYPLFRMELQPDGSFMWEAPFHPHVKLPWLDAEHDVGPAVLQIFKDGVKKWGGQSMPLAYEMLSPVEACEAFARGIGRKVTYRRRSKIDVKVKIPSGYREQLVALEAMYALGKEDASKQPPYFATQALESRVPEQALALWEGPRGLEEYAREVFPLEEAANGLTWMNEGTEGEETEGIDGELVGGEEENEGSDGDDDDDDDDDDGLVMGGGTGGENTPARREESWLA
ncbi:NmrA-like family-domain-containing protein [Amylocarpus encephaloides]|uniref:NmrA-like family-domain-containing protein n=1 Tax=Amylocarpus encephaloides TaxID=45428 RepID=A0A9P8C3F3_9HELO|nr:NmrA-like family-domain-containing protein [Amylocarpus encephaloides]